jgi:hypothetical protein
MLTSSKSIADAIEQTVKRLDIDHLRREYWRQNEFVHLQEFLPPAIVQDTFGGSVARLKPLLNRNYIPKRKKGGSVSYFIVRERAPEFVEMYRSPAFLTFLSTLVGHPLLLCPDHDPHSCALYYYTEPGDHIGFHYDTSYYKGARYTVLMGLVDRSEHCKLIAHVQTDRSTSKKTEMQVRTGPGDMVIFNGDKLWHAVTPLGEGEERVVLTLEYVTSQEMGPVNRLYSNLKDAFGYFGLRAFWGMPKPVKT